MHTTTRTGEHFSLFAVYHEQWQCYKSQMEINLVQITRFKDKTKYACATFDPLIGTGVVDDTGGQKLIGVPVGG